MTDEQLGIANGWVRCGQCLVSFDAKEQLWTSPDKGSRPVAWLGDLDRPPPRPALAQTAAGAAPAPDSPSRSGGRAASHSVPAPVEEPEISLESDLSRNLVSLGEVDQAVDLDTGPEGPSIGDVRRVQGPAVADSGTRARRQGDATGTAERRRRARDKAILARIERSSGRRGSAISFAACLLLLAGLALQVTWFEPGRLLEHVPAAGPLVERFCELTRCPGESLSDAEVSIKSRTVRPHPRVEGAILVSATLENRAETPQPFPALMLILYGTDGRPIASREFEVDEYLEDLEGEDFPGGGIPPGDRVEIEFEFAAPLEVVLSFDLRLV